MGKINSKKKGSRGELELSKFLTAHGHPARRGQQFQGTPESPDIICESLEDIHIECKRTERLQLYKAMEQASADAGPHQTPVVFHRQSRKDWLVILDAEEFLKILDKGREKELRLIKKLKTLDECTHVLGDDGYCMVCGEA